MNSLAADFQFVFSKSFWDSIMGPAFAATFEILIATTILGTILGFFLAIALVVTNERGIHPNKKVYGVLSVIVNIVRSFPFLILMVFLMPFTKFVVGTSIGVKAAIVPLTVSATAFIAKLIENAMQEVDPALVEAMRSFGISNKQVVFKVMMSEAMPSIMSGIVLATISILGATAVSGTMGAGGIGTVATVYGYQSFNYPVMWTTAIILVIFVEGIQLLGDKIYKKLKD